MAQSHVVLTECTAIITPSRLTCKLSDVKKEKILFINSNETFDLFTCSYGYLDTDNNVKIKWDPVAQDFAGIGLCDDIDRYNNVYFYGKEYDSWTKNYNLDYFLITSPHLLQRLVLENCTFV